MQLVMEAKVRCCKEQYCMGTWNVRSMNQGKLEVVKQETARVNVDILGISELKWTGMGEFNSDDHYISHTSNAMLKILQVRLQQYVNHELPDVQAHNPIHSILYVLQKQ